MVAITISNASNSNQSYTFPSDDHLLDKVAAHEGLPTLSITLTGTPQKFLTMRDLFSTLWVGWKNNDFANDRQQYENLKKFLRNRLKMNETYPTQVSKRQAKEIVEWMVYFLLRPLEDMTDITSEQLELIKNDGISLLAQTIDTDFKKWGTTFEKDVNEYLGDFETFIQKMQEKGTNEVEELRKRWVSPEINIPLIEMSEPQYVSKMVKLQSSSVRASEYTLDDVFARMCATSAVPVMEYKKLFKLFAPMIHLLNPTGFDWRKHKDIIVRLFRASQLTFTDRNVKATDVKSNTLFHDELDSGTAFIVLSWLDGSIGFVFFDAKGHLLVFVPDVYERDVHDCLAHFDTEVRFNAQKEPFNISAIVDFKGLQFDSLLLDAFLFLESGLAKQISHNDKHAFKPGMLKTLFWSKKLSSDASRDSASPCTLTNMKDIVDDSIMTRLEMEALDDPEVLDDAVKTFQYALSLFVAGKNALETQFREKCGYEPQPPPIDTSIRAQFPKYFKGNYTKQCTYPPTIITTAESRQIDKEKWRAFTIAGQKVLLSCHLSEKPYIKVKRNSYGHRDELPWVPCCHEKDQTNSAALLAFDGNEPEAHEVKKQQIFLTTHTKSLKPSGIGALPTGLSNFLYSLHTAHPLFFARVGMNSKYLSFVECILYALNYDAFREKKVDEKDSTIQKVLTKIRENKNHALNFGAQQFPQHTVEEVMQMVNSLIGGETYCDPRQWMCVMEEFFNCSIFVFAHVDEHEVEVVYPHFEMMYLMAKKPRKHAIFVYEHDNKGEIPRCELIGERINIDKHDISSIDFQSMDQCGEAYADIYMNEWVRNLTYSEHTNELIKVLPLLSPSNIPKFTAQHLDKFGKCRALQIEGMWLWCDPLPPFALRNEENVSYQPVQTILTLDRDRFQLVSTSGDKHSTRECHYEHPLFPGTIFTLKTRTQKVFDDVPRTHDRYPNYDDELEMFCRYNRIAQIFPSYVLYMFAQYLNEHEVQFGIESFVKTRMRVIKSSDDSSREDNVPVSLSDLLSEFLKSVKVLGTHVTAFLQRIQQDPDSVVASLVERKMQVTPAQQKKLINILHQFTEYLHSLGISLEWPVEPKAMMVKRIATFIQEYIVVNEAVKYQIPKDSRLSPAILRKYGFIDEDKRLVMDSVECQQKVAYMLTYQISLGEDVRPHGKQKHIHHFYRALTDWTSDPNTVVLREFNPRIHLTHQIHNFIDGMENYGFFAYPGFLNNQPVFYEKVADRFEALGDASASSHRLIELQLENQPAGQTISVSLQGNREKEPHFTAHVYEPQVFDHWYRIQTL